MEGNDNSSNNDNGNENSIYDNGNLQFIHDFIQPIAGNT